MSETSDRALDLADQWAKAIGQKLTDAAPGAYDVAVEAVKVKIGSEILSWVILLISFIIAATISYRFFMWATKLEREGKSSDEYGPTYFISIVTGVIGVIMLLVTLINFPSREIVGLFAPKGYVALMLFDSVKSRK